MTFTVVRINHADPEAVEGARMSDRSHAAAHPTIMVGGSAKVSARRACDWAFPSPWAATSPRSRSTTSSSAASPASSRWCRAPRKRLRSLSSTTPTGPGTSSANSSVEAAPAMREKSRTKSQWSTRPGRRWTSSEPKGIYRFPDARAGHRARFASRPHRPAPDVWWHVGRRGLARRRTLRHIVATQ